MTEVDLALFLGTLAVIAWVAIAVTVVLLGTRLGRYLATIQDDRQSLRDAGWRATTALELTQANTHRLAVAIDKAVDDRPAQQEARRLAEQNENLVLGITSILDAEILPDEGARPDYAAGHARGVSEVKAKLKDELSTALKPTQ